MAKKNNKENKKQKNKGAGMFTRVLAIVLLAAMLLSTCAALITALIRG